MEGAPDTIGEAFFANVRPLDQRQIDWLTQRHGVPVMALAGDGDGTGWCLATARVERVGRRFDFRPEDGVGAFVTVARDEDGWGVDLVAWDPKGEWITPWVGGEVAVLGQHELLAPRLGEPLAVHRDALSWLRAGRSGVVILPPASARRLLENLPLQADDVQHGEELRRLLTPPRPRIMVPALSNLEAA